MRVTLKGNTEATFGVLCTHIDVALQCLQDVVFGFRGDVDDDSVIEEVIVFVGRQVLRPLLVTCLSRHRRTLQVSNTYTSIMAWPNPASVKHVHLYNGTVKPCKCQTHTPLYRHGQTLQVSNTYTSILARSNPASVKLINLYNGMVKPCKCQTHTLL